MKLTIPFFIIVLFFFSCGNSEHSNTVSDTKKVQAQLTEMRPAEYLQKLSWSRHLSNFPLAALL